MPGTRNILHSVLNLLRNVVLGNSRQHFLDIAVIFTLISHLPEWVSLWDMVLWCIISTTCGQAQWWTHVNPLAEKTLFSKKSEVWTVFFLKTKTHFYNKEIIFYITPGYWCVPGIRDYFYRYELWITSHSPSTSFKTWFTQHKKRPKGN